MQQGANVPPLPISIPVPPMPISVPVPANAEGKSLTAWNELRFSPIGVYHLRCWQGVFPGIKDFFITCQKRFQSSDIAWFASGMNRDGNHNHSRNSFHPSMVLLVKDTSAAQAKIERKVLLAEVKEHLFDMVCFFLSHCNYIQLIIYLQGNYV